MDPIHLNTYRVPLLSYYSKGSLSLKLSLFSTLPQRALAFDHSIWHDHSSAVKHSRCLKWGLHLNLWNSLNFLHVLQHLTKLPKKATNPHYSFLFQFRIHVFIIYGCNNISNPPNGVSLHTILYSTTVKQFQRKSEEEKNGSTLCCGGG